MQEIRTYGLTGGKVASAATPRRGSRLKGGGGAIVASLVVIVGIAASAFAAAFDSPDGILVEDKNYIGVGAGTFESTDIVDLNGHKLYIDHTALNGAVFIDSSSGDPGELHVSVPGGEAASIDGASISGNLKVVKEGAGCMLMRPQDIAVECAEGRLDIGGKLPIHRWSFTGGSLADSGVVGGKTAVEQTANAGAISYADNAVTFSGGANGDCWLNLGADVIPSSGDVTIELWGRRNATTHQWASMFSIGVNGNNNDSLRMAWSDSDAGDGKTDLVYLKQSGDVFYVANSMTPYTVGTYYHISMRIVQNADGSAVFTWSKRNTVTGAIENTRTENVASGKGWSLAKYKGNPLVLNHGYCNDDEAATYDEVRIWDCALSDAELTDNAIAGPDAFPAESPRRTAEIVETPELIHRWSFTGGSLADSGVVGGKTAVEQTANAGAISYADNAVTFSGGANGDCWLNLGADVIPSSGDVTIELWGRRNAATHQWASMFSIGVNGNNNDSLRMAWSNHDAGDGKTDMVYLKQSGDVFYVANSMTPYTVGTYYHISMRIVQNADGSAVFTWSKRNAGTGAIEKTHTVNVASGKGWSLAKYKGNPLVLNHGYDNDDEAATYDEVRIWNGALSDEQLTMNAKLGPDRVVATPNQGKCGSMSVSAGATLATPADGVSCTRLSGAGTLAANSALVVEEALDIAGDATGTFTVSGDLTVSGDWLWDGGLGQASDRIAGTGTLNLADATFVPRFAVSAIGVLQMADGVAITGYDQMTLPSPRKFKIKYANGRLNLVRPGFVIYVK